MIKNQDGGGGEGGGGDTKTKTHVSVQQKQSARRTSSHVEFDEMKYKNYNETCATAVQLVVK